MDMKVLMSEIIFVYSSSASIYITDISILEDAPKTCVAAIELVEDKFISDPEVVAVSIPVEEMLNIEPPEAIAEVVCVNETICPVVKALPATRSPIPDDKAVATIEAMVPEVVLVAVIIARVPTVEVVEIKFNKKPVLVVESAPVEDKFSKEPPVIIADVVWVID